MFFLISLPNDLQPRPKIFFIQYAKQSNRKIFSKLVPIDRKP